MSRFIKLPENISFSSFRPHPTKERFDEFDIIKDGVIIHTMEVDFRGSFGSGQEEFQHMEAHHVAEEWLLRRHLLPAEPMSA